MKRCVRLLVLPCLVVVLGGCGPLGVGLGLNELLSDDPAPDLVNPTVSFLRESGAPVGPFETTTDVTFRVVRNKSNIAVRALVVGPGFAASAGALDADGCPDAALFGPVISGGEFTLPGLADLSEYTVYLRGEDSSGRVDCTTHTFFVDTQPPAAPVVLQVRARRARELEVSWTRPTDAGSGVRGYRVYYDVGGRSIPDDRVRTPGETYVPATFLAVGQGGSVPVPLVEGAANTSFTLRGLFACRKHYIAVTAVDFAGNETPLSAGREVVKRTRAGSDGTYAPAYALGFGGDYFAIGDVNKDGNPDIVHSNDNKTRTAFGTIGTDGRPSPTFVVGETIGSGGRLALGDVDGNHTLDLVGDVTILSGEFGERGLTTLEPGSGSGTGGIPLPTLRIALADLDRNGTLDVMETGFNIVSAYSGNTIEVTGASQPNDFDHGDIDGDGKDDLAATFEGAVRIGLYSGEIVQVVVGADPFGVAIGDYDGDQLMDIATANRDGSLSFVFGNGDGTFGGLRKQTVGTGAGRLYKVDFDEDGILDFAVGESLANTVQLMRGNGDGTFTLTQTNTYGGTICDVQFVDMNADRMRDLVVLTRDETYISLARGARGVGDGTFHHTSVRAGGAHSLRTADFNSDGAVDVAGVSYTGPVIQLAEEGPVAALIGDGEAAQGTGTFTGRTTISNATAEEIGVGDFDGDGVPDVVSDAGELLLGLGDGGFASPAAYPIPGAPYAQRLFVEDMDRDGALDVVLAESRDIVIVYGELVNGQRTGKVRETVRIPADAGQVAVADLNDDLWPDLVITIARGDVVTRMSNRNGTFADAVTVYTATGAGFLAFVADLDADSIPDIIANDSDDGQTYFVRGIADADGFATGTFEDPVVIIDNQVVGFEFLRLWSLAPGDVDGDGILDLLMGFGQSGNPVGAEGLSIWIGKGDGTFTQGAALPDPSSGDSPLLVDLNSDGILDIVASDDEEVRVLTGSGVVVGD